MKRVRINEEYRKLAMQLTRTESREVSRAFGPKRPLGIAISEGLHPIIRVLALLEYASISLWVERRLIETLKSLTQAGFITADELYRHLTELHEVPEEAGSALVELLQLQDSEQSGEFAEFRERIRQRVRQSRNQPTSPEQAFSDEDRDLLDLEEPGVEVPPQELETGKGRGSGREEFPEAEEDSNDEP